VYRPPVQLPRTPPSGEMTARLRGFAPGAGLYYEGPPPGSEAGNEAGNEAGRNDARKQAIEG